MNTSLNDTVINGGYCIGCGVCTAVSGSTFQIVTDELGQYHAELSGEDEVSAAVRVCPFSSHSRDETDIGRVLYGDHATFDEHIGFHRANFVGHVAEGDFRERGSSGGMGKWILHDLLRRGLVDTVIQIGAHQPTPDDPKVYGYTIMQRPEEVLLGSKSVYYPVEMSEMLMYVREHPGRYAITGIPCFIKAVRLLAAEEPVFRERIVFCVGVICGHLKSRRYADMIAWQFGVEPGDLEAIDFRAKLPGVRANEKGVKVRSAAGNEPAPDIVQNLFGTNYNHGFFQYYACNFCDDVVGETADVSVGDAWLDEYMADGRGTNVVVVRHPVIHRLVEEGIADGRLALKEVGAKVIAESQAGGFRQRREGLAYRLHLADKRDRWRPPKRFEPRSHHIDRKRRQIYELRMEMTERSHEAFSRALDARDFEVFRLAMQPLLDAYSELYRPSVWRRVRRGIERRVQWVREWFVRNLGTSFETRDA